MNKIRSFVAIPLPEDIRRSIRRLLNKLRQDDDGIAWVPVDNLHLTLKFLGDVHDTEVPAVCQAIHEACDGLAPFPLTISGIGALPSWEKARVLHAGVSDPDSVLIRLVADLETRLAELGYKREPRDYVPHLTLGRAKGVSRRASLEVLERLKQFEKFHAGEVVVDQIQLVASFLDKSGPTYQTMATVQL